MLKPRSPEIGSDAPRVRFYSPELQPLMQSLLATLADIEFEHESELSKLRASRMDARIKSELLCRLKARHQERREPYVIELTRLERRAADLLA